MKTLFEALRLILEPERLEDLPPRPGDPTRRGLAGWLFGREPLPHDNPQARAKGPSFLSWLLRPEDLPGNRSGGGGGESKP